MAGKKTGSGTIPNASAAPAAKPAKAAKPSFENSPCESDDCYKTGVDGLDRLLGKGIPVASSVLVEGGPGSGKTLLCLNIAANFCKRGKKVLYMSFEEPEEKLVAHMRSFGWDADKYVKSGNLRIKRFNALDIARSVEALLSEAKKELLIEINPVFFPSDFDPDLVLVDSLTSISSAFSGEESRFRIYMEQLFRYLERKHISSLLIREVANPSHTGKAYVEAGEAVSFLSDGIIVIYNVLYPSGKRGSALEVLKLRGAPIIKKIVEMEITPKGVAVHADRQVPGNCTLT